MFLRELSIARQFNHPHVVKLHEFFQGNSIFHLVMELCTGGDLVDKLNAEIEKNGHKFPGGFRAPQVARYAWQMLNGIAYMHHYKFAHRDIKPENFMLANTSRTAQLKLIDFGLARSFEGCQKMYSRVGSLSYMAPEVKASPSDGYDMKCDIWSIGVTLYSLASGSHPCWSPAEGGAPQELIFPTDWWSGHPPQLQGLIRSLLSRNPQQRPHAKLVLEADEWLRKHGMQPVAGQKSCCGIV